MNTRKGERREDQVRGRRDGNLEDGREESGGGASSSKGQVVSFIFLPLKEELAQG